MYGLDWCAARGDTVPSYKAVDSVLLTSAVVRNQFPNTYAVGLMFVSFAFIPFQMLPAPLGAAAYRNSLTSSGRLLRELLVRGISVSAPVPELCTLALTYRRSCVRATHPEISAIAILRTMVSFRRRVRSGV